MELFVFLPLHKNDNRGNIPCVPLNFITVKLISRILTHTDLQRCTFMHLFFYHNCIFCIVIHGYYVFIYTVISA